MREYTFELQFGDPDSNIEVSIPAATRFCAELLLAEWYPEAIDIEFLNAS